jgi:hypothetical protein
MKKLFLLILCCIFVTSCYSKDEIEIIDNSTVEKMDTIYMENDFKEYVNKQFDKILRLPQGYDRKKASTELSYTIANSIQKKPNTIYIFDTVYVENQTSKTWIVKELSLVDAVYKFIYNGSKILSITITSEGTYEIEVDF